MSLERRFAGELHAGVFMRSALRKGKRVEEVIRAKEQVRGYRLRIVPATARLSTKDELVSILLGTHGLSDKLYFCPICAGHGALPELFQLSMFAVCPVHSVPISHLCAHCEWPIVRSQLYLGEPFSCRRCGQAFHGGATQAEEEIVESLLLELENRCGDLLTKLVPLIVPFLSAPGLSGKPLTVNEQTRLRDFCFQLLLAQEGQYPDYVDAKAIRPVRAIFLETGQSEFDSAQWRKAATAVAQQILAAVLSVTACKAAEQIAMEEGAFLRLFENAPPRRRDELVAYWHWRNVIRGANEQRRLPWGPSITAYREAALGFFLRLLETDVLFELERPGLAWSHDASVAFEAVYQVRPVGRKKSRSLFVFWNERCEQLSVPTPSSASQ